MVPNLTRIQSTSFLKLSLPLIFEVTFVIIVTNLVVWMLSQYDPNLAGGVAVAGQINNLIFLFFSIISMGAGILIAQSVGAKSTQNRQEVFSISLFFALIFAGIGTLIYLLFYKQIFSFYSLSETMTAFAEQYGVILAPFFVLNALFLVFNQTLYAHGKTLEALLALLLCDSAILIASYLLISGLPLLNIPPLGVIGAASAIVLGRIIYFLSLGFFIRNNLGLRFTFIKKNPFKLKTTALLFKVGAPAVLENVSYTIFMIFITRLIAEYGDTAILAKTYFDSLAMWTYFVCAALANASAIKVGQLVGGGQFKEAESTIKFSISLAYIATIVPSISLALIMGVISRLFTTDPVVQALMISIAFADILLESGRVINLVVNRAMKASGDARYPLLSIIVIQWLIILPLTYILSRTLNLGFLGIWIALAIDECIRGVNLYRRWQSKRWQIKSQTLNQSLANPSP